MSFQQRVVLLVFFSTNKTEETELAYFDFSHFYFSFIKLLFLSRQKFSFINEGKRLAGSRLFYTFIAESLQNNSASGIQVVATD